MRSLLLASHGCDDYCHKFAVEYFDVAGMARLMVASSAVVDDDGDGFRSRCDAQQMRLRTAAVVDDGVEALAVFYVARSCDECFPVDPDLVELNYSTSSDCWERCRP